ncbi:putative recombination protein with metallo-hydrolase domain [Klebsiella aerogenes]|nr:putative recombination protein with metallo-hydrolase domain [Klebsiella aerogenes]
MLFFCVRDLPPAFAKKLCLTATDTIVWKALRTPEFGGGTPPSLCVTLPAHREVFMRLPWLAGCAIIAMLPLLWLPRLAGHEQSGGRERIGAGADSSAWKGRRRSGDDASAGGLGSIERASGAVADPAPYRRHPAGGSDPQRDGWPGPAPWSDCAPGGPLPVSPGGRDAVRGTYTCARLCGSALVDDAAPAPGARAAQRRGLRQPALCAGAAPAAERGNCRSFRAGSPLQPARPLSGVADPASGALSLACGDAGIRDGGAD